MFILYLMFVRMMGKGNNQKIKGHFFKSGLYKYIFYL